MGSAFTLTPAINNTDPIITVMTATATTITRTNIAGTNGSDGIGTTTIGTVTGIDPLCFRITN